MLLLIGRYYLWSVRSAGYEFEWGRDHGGYYNYLGRALASGRLHLPIDSSIEMHDMARHNGRYYLYHGAAPAVLLFAPWRWATGHDLPENLALFLLCFGGFLFSAGTLLKIFELGGITPGPALTAVSIAAVGLCQCVPYLLSRVWVYEVAIGGGYFFLSAAFFFLVYGLSGRHAVYSLAASGLMFGMAIGCRPHLGFAAPFALGGLLLMRVPMRRIAIFLMPFLTVCALIGAYNFARFGDPFDFGITHLIAGEHQNRIKLSAEYLAPGLYYLLFCAPEVMPVFPWFHVVFRPPYHSPGGALPAGYVIEAATGAFYVSPILLGALFLWAAKGMARILLGVLLATAGAICIVLASAGWVTQRYEVDFLPYGVLAAVAAVVVAIAKTGGLSRMMLTAFFGIAVAFGIVVNLALGIAGPYHEMLKRRPGRFVTIAGWFSPVAGLRPALNPRLTVEFTVHLDAKGNGVREPLLTLGHQAARYFLIAQSRGEEVEVVSQADDSTERCVLRADGPLSFRVQYAPETGNVTVDVNGAPAMNHHIGALVTAPSQITPGENRVEANISAARFSGRLEKVRIEVGR